MRSAVVSALLLLAVLLPPKPWRAGLGETVWESLVLTTHPAPEIVRLAALALLGAPGRLGLRSGPRRVTALATALLGAWFERVR